MSMAPSRRERKSMPLSSNCPTKPSRCSIERPRRSSRQTTKASPGSSTTMHESSLGAGWHELRTPCRYRCRRHDNPTSSRRPVIAAHTAHPGVTDQLPNAGLLPLCFLRYKRVGVILKGEMAKRNRNHAVSEGNCGRRSSPETRPARRRNVSVETH